MSSPKHIRLSQISALLICCMIPSPAAAAKLVAEFNRVGDVCLGLGSTEREDVLKHLSGVENAAITLVGYSDSHDMADQPQIEDCLTREIPAFIQGHDRIAVARALYVYELANRAGLPGFDAQPMFRVGFGASDMSSDPSIVAIVAGRAAAGDTYARRVEMVVSPLPPPPPPVKVTVEGPVINVPDVTPDLVGISDGLTVLQSRTPQILRAVGWSQFGVGLVVASVGGAFLVNGAVQHRVAADTIDPERAALLEADGYQYIRSGGWATAIGAGLVVGGIAMLIVARKMRRDKRTSKATSMLRPGGRQAFALAFSYGGIGLRW